MKYLANLPKPLHFTVKLMTSPHWYKLYKKKPYGSSYGLVHKRKKNKMADQIT